MYLVRGLCATRSWLGRVALQPVEASRSTTAQHTLGRLDPGLLKNCAKIRGKTRSWRKMHESTMQTNCFSSLLSGLLYPNIFWAVRSRAFGEIQTTNSAKFLGETKPRRKSMPSLQVEILVRVVEGRSGAAAVARLLPHTTYYDSQ